MQIDNQGLSVSELREKTLDAEYTDDLEQMLSYASEWAKLDCCSVDAHDYKGVALCEMAKDHTNGKEAITLTSKARDCFQKALDLSSSQNRSESDQRKLKIWIRKCVKLR